jgi:aquaporin Z
MKYISELIVEGVGTFFFLTVILKSNADKTIGPIGVAVALLAAIYMGDTVSGAHYNPAVTASMILDNKITFYLGMCYIMAQLLGAFSAYLFNDIILRIKNE